MASIPSSHVSGYVSSDFSATMQKLHSAYNKSPDAPSSDDGSCPLLTN